MSIAASPDVLFLNARVLTMDPRLPIADAVAIKGDRIRWVGRVDESPASTDRHTRVVDCDGATVLPGFIDAHCHVLAYAASLLEVDCRPPAVGSIDDIIEAIRRRATETPSGNWIRAQGYQEQDLEEGRHPDRWDLDKAAPDHPVRLMHRSRHAVVLNTVGLNAVGIAVDTDEPAGGVIERDPATGEPTGLLLEMTGWLSKRLPLLETSQLDTAVILANQKLLSLGLTSLTDAGANNTPETWETFSRLRSSDLLGPHVTMLAGINNLDRFQDGDLTYGASQAGLRLGPAKIMLTATAGELTPSPDELTDLIASAVQRGFPVAVHAVESEAVRAAARSLMRVSPLPKRIATPHRIEHCSECPVDVLSLLSSSDVAVVTNPVFLNESGDRYLNESDEQTETILYRVRSLLDAGVLVASGSDTPVASPNPLIGIHAAVTRESSSGQIVGHSERVALTEALAMYTRNAAAADGQSHLLGSITAGKLANLVVLDADITEADPAVLLDVRVSMTLVGGRLVYEA